MQKNILLLNKTCKFALHTYSTENEESNYIYLLRKVILYIFILLLSTNSKVFSQHEESVDSILAKAMKAAESYSEVVEEYNADIYMRVYVQTL